MFKKLHIYLVINFLCLACLGAQELKVQVLSVPEFDMSGIKQIAIVDFLEKDSTERLGRDLAGYLTTTMVQASTGNTGSTLPLLQEFNGCGSLRVIEQAQIDKIIAEHKRQLMGFTDPDSFAVEVGRLANVQAIITGSINYHTSDRDTKVRVLLKSIDVVERSVNLIINMRVLSVETGRTIASMSTSKICKAISPRDSNSQIWNMLKDRVYAKFALEEDNCGKDLWGESEIVQHLLQDVSPELANGIAAGVVERSFAIKKVKVNKKLRSCEKKARQLAESIDATSVDTAYLIYASMLKQNPYSHELNYNVGLLNEVVGNFSQARDLYKTALSIKKKEKLYQTANQRIEVILRATSAISCVVEYEWPEFYDDPAEACIPEVQITQDCEIYDDPNGEVIAPLPSGLVVKLVEDAGDWFLIRLPDGIEGFIRKDFAKLI